MIKQVIILVLVAAVAWLVYQQRRLMFLQTQIGSPDTALSHGALSHSALSQPQLQIQAPTTKLLALTLAVKATPRQLPEGRPLSGQFRVSAPAANAGDIYVADSPASCSTGPRYSINAGQSQEIHISDLAMLYYFGTLNDTLAILAEVTND